MRETSKSFDLRKQHGDFVRYLHGNGIDIGAGNDCLRVPSGNVYPWDVDNGDAQELTGVPDASFDFVYSSHCLEHMRDVARALANWTRVLKIGGALYVAVPDYTLYEKLRWPSPFNDDHKQSFSLQITRYHVRRDNHHHIWGDLGPVLAALHAPLLEARLEDLGFDYNVGAQVDQTQAAALAQVCFVARKLG